MTPRTTPSSRSRALGAGFVVLSLVALACEPDTAREKGPDPDAPRSGAPSRDPALPGIADPDAGFQQELDRALRSQGPDYRPRTDHLKPDGSPRFTNRLILESSPYLLQHAHNPVNWHPWSDEAFERAKRENKPVFLSVGYSTCHWCHVMERESFEDEEIAVYLNRHFVPIKVDREQRPDVDSVYMTAVQMLTGRGGWPMTVILTPDKDPFFGGTYFPPRSGVRGARAGLIDILRDAAALYRNNPTRAIQEAQELSQRVARLTAMPRMAGVPSDRVIIAAVRALSSAFDPVDGGFGAAPKFPQPGRLALLLRYARRTRDPGALSIVTTTLDRMADGGIYDQIGGGFHRYSTDAEWLVPHFEKMLYDNAQLASVYLEAWQFTGDGEYRRVAREILDYVAREMTSSAGGFYSATDADSPTPDGHDAEGRFFTWTPSELEALLGAERAAVVAEAYGVARPGNFEGRSILHRAKSDAQVSEATGMPARRVAQVLSDARPVLFAARAEREPPIRDDKVIAAWNGLMISAFALGAWVFVEPRYEALAIAGARFVLDEMRDESGSLVRTSKSGKKPSAAFLDDYAFMVAACLQLYQATGEVEWLDAAIGLQTRQDAAYLDTQQGGYFLAAHHGEELLVREKPSHDGAVPSGNSVAALNLLRLSDFTGEPAWRTRAESLFRAFGAGISRAPVAYPELLVALDYYYDVPREIAIVAEDERPTTALISKRLASAFVPSKVFCVLSEESASAQRKRVPWLEGKRPMKGEPTAYVCERGQCDLPTPNPSVFQRQIDQRQPYPSYTEAPPPRLPVPVKR